jgi:hypothetical protein
MTANYTITYQPGTLTINKAAAPAITWPTANGLTYGQKLSESTLSGGSTEYGSPIDIHYNGVGIINAPSAEEYEEMFQERLKQKRSKEEKTA